MTKESPARRGRPRDPERMRRVIEAAAQQFLEHGYDRASMDAVAQASGVSKMTLYNYFPSKEMLFEACVTSRTERMFEGFTQSPLDPTRTEESLRLIARQFLALMRADDVLQIHRTLFGIASSQPEVCERFFNAGPQRVRKLVRAYLMTAIQAGELMIDDVPTATDQFLALLLGTPHLRAMLGMGTPTPEEDEALISANVALFMASYRRH